MDGLGFILIVVLVFAFITGPMLSLVIAHRKEKKKNQAPTEQALRNARRKLSNVTNKPRLSPTQTDDIEAAASDPEECSICMGPLVPEPVQNNISVADRRRSVIDMLLTVATKKKSSTTGRQMSQVDEETQVTIQEPAASSPDDQSTATTNAGVVQPVEPAREPGDDDIMILKTCHHSFHAKCLASWFVIQRFDCPICRTTYYTSSPDRTKGWRRAARQLSRVA